MIIGRIIILLSTFSSELSDVIRVCSAGLNGKLSSLKLISAYMVKVVNLLSDIWPSNITSSK